MANWRSIVFSMYLLLLGGQPLRHGAKPLQLPGDHKFPGAEEALLQLRDEQNVSLIRTHAWDLFAGLTDSNEPIWESWYTKCDVKLFSGDACQTASGSNQRRLLKFEIPVQSMIAFQGNSKSQGTDDLAVATKFLTRFHEHPQLAGVLYNEAAANHILSHHLFDAATLAGILQSRKSTFSPQAEREIPPFPRDAVVLKTAWQFVTEKQNHLTDPLYIWNPDKHLPPGTSLEDTSGWGNSVIIDTSAKPCEDRDYTAPQGSKPIVPLNCFYYMKLTNGRDFPQELVNAVGPFGAPSTTGVYLILVAVHVITKETPDWVWATFWWHNQPSLNPDRPPSIKGNKWRHFLMDTTLSATTPPDDTQQPKICFNPFLEETFPNGTHSNCMGCHAKAVFGSTRSVNTNPPPPGYFDNALQTDFMWTLAGVKNESIRKFIKDLQALNPPP